MQISLRSHLIAGTAAVVGASAIALTPVVAQHEMLPNIQLPTASSAVALAGFDSPVTELINTLNLFPSLLFSNDPTLVPVVSRLGLLPQIINDALPVVRQLGVNGSAYLLSTLNALVVTGQTLSEGVWNFPQAVLDSIKTASLTPLITAITDTVNTIGTTLLAAGNYVVTGVVARGEALLNTVTSSVSTLINTVIGQVTSLVNSAVYVGKSVIGATSIVGAWNAAVDGLLGPGKLGAPSIPGALVSLTLGLGQLLDPTSPPSLTNPFVPSARTVVSGLVQAVKADLATPDTATPVPVPPPAAAKKVASSTAAVKKVAPGVAAVSTGGNGGGSSSSSSSSKGSSSNGGSDRGSSHASNH